MKKFVIVKHLQDNGKFLFYVPKSVILHAGDKVVCDTSRGTDQLGVCCCDDFLSDPAVVCPLFGTQERMMKYVTGTINLLRFEIEEEEDDKN